MNKHDKDKYIDILDKEESIKRIYYEYILSWFTSIIQRPYEKTGILILLKGEQGSGKTLMADFFRKMIIGSRMAIQMDGLDGFLQKHNDYLRGQLFVNLNELSSIAGNNFHGVFDKLKSFITDEKIKIEPKGQPSCFIDNFINILATTNNNFTLKVENGDRRCFVLEVSNSLVGNYSYFDKLVEHIYNQENANHFFTYLKNNKITGNLKRIPSTELKESMIEMSLSSPRRFYNYVNDKLKKKPNWGSDWEKIIHNNIQYMKSEKFYCEYKNWCIDFNEKTFSLHNFRSELKELNKIIFKDGKTMRVMVICE